jgi:CD109 antigen
MLVSGAFAVFGIFLLSSASEGTDPSYVIVAPETIRPGLKSRISVTILKADQDVTVQLDLTASNADGVLSSTQATILPGTSKILELMMPIDLPSTYGTYALNATGSGGLTFSNSTTVQVNSKCMSVFIQTDKGIYKPGQTVQMRIIAYKPSLLPFSGNVTVTVMDPNTNLVANWLDVVVTEGVAKREFPLSIEPPVGTWKIKVTGDCASQEKTFTVDKYVLPKFSVTVNPPTYVLTSNKQIQGTVSAKYTYGKPVQGSLHLTFSLPNQYRWISKSVSDEQVVLTQTYKIDGTAAFSVNSTLIAKLASTQISSDTPSLPSYGSLAINASVTETLTGITLDGYAVTQFFEYPINVAFHESTPETFKPGLPFTGRVVISTPDKKPVLDSEGLKIKISTTIHNSTSSATSINKYPVIGGQVVFTEDIPAGTTSLSFRAFYKYGSHKIDAFRYPSVSKSPSNSFMQLTSHSSNVEPGQKAVYELKSTFILKTIHYQVMARGNIISQSTHTVEGANTSTVLEVLLTVDMAPSARLLVYTVLDDGEVVADSLTISVANAFQNKVNVSFSSLESKPGDSVSVSVLASPGSYVGILAVDYSITLLAGGNDISQSAVRLTYVVHKLGVRHILNKCVQH